MGLTTLVFGLVVSGSPGYGSGQSEAQEQAHSSAPIEIQAIALRENSSGSHIDISSTGRLVWRAGYSDDGHLQIRFSNSAPAPGLVREVVGDQLVSRLLIVAEPEDGASVLLIQTRDTAGYTVRVLDDGVQITLRAVSDTEARSTQTIEPVPTTGASNVTAGPAKPPPEASELSHEGLPTIGSDAPQVSVLVTESVGGSVSVQDDVTKPGADLVADDRLGYRRATVTSHGGSSEQIGSWPETPVRGSLKKFQIQKLLIDVISIALAVLLVLGMNQWREQRANRALAETALKNVALELRANRDLLALLNVNNGAVMASISDAEDQSQEPEAFIPGLQLQEIAWNALLSTGTSSYADYQTILTLSESYSIQRVYKEMGVQLVQADLNTAAYAAAAGTAVDEQQKLRNFAGFFELLVAIEIELLRSYKATLAELGNP